MSSIIIHAAERISTLFLGTSRSDDSVGDRLSYRYTCAILIAFAIIVSNREFTSKRIQCWVPAFFTGNYEDYTNNVCWVRNTYYVDDDSEIPESKAIRRESSIRYYQWIPFILLFQAFLFYMPYVLWRILCQRSGIDIRDIVDGATNYKKSSDEKQSERLMKIIVSVIDQYVDDPRRQSNTRETVWWKKCFLVFFPSSGRYMGDYLRNLFIFIKIIYVANVFLQILVLSFFLGQPFWSLGITVIRLLYQGKGWDFTSQYFPKVTLCDFQIREANALPIAHTYTVMCVLPINLFNQQIFTFLWFWFVFVVILSIYDLFIWIYRLFFRRETYLEERLKIMEYELAKKWPFKDSCKDHVNIKDNEHLMRIQSRDETVSTTGDEVYTLSDGRRIHHQSRMFIVPPVYYKNDGRSIFEFFNKEYLEADGHFILRIIGTNASEFVSTIIIHHLYQLCCEKRFSSNTVEKLIPPPRTTLYKYLVIPKEGPVPEPSTHTQELTMLNNGRRSSKQTDLPRTPSTETRPSTNPLAQYSVPQPTISSIHDQQHPPEIKRRTSHYASHTEHELRPRSGTQPFLEQPDSSQYLSTMRSGNGSLTAKRNIYHPKHDEHDQEDDQEEEQ